jgi:acyl-coenzyme A thioesterase PaaI-like protein
LIARATAVSAGKTQAVCRGEVYAVDQGVEKVCLIAQGMVLRAAHAPTPQARGAVEDAS